MPTQLGEFIRMHRERLRPVDFGLSEHGRRRTPGLRREELAMLCGVSPTWLTWIEQGRPISVSAKVLMGLADLLRLSPAERAYLFRLANKIDPVESMTSASGSVHGIDLHAVVHAIKTPAYILDRYWNAIAWNRPAKNLFAGWLDQSQVRVRDPSRNLLKFMFLEPMARTLVIDWPNRAQRVVAEFRSDCGNQASQEPMSTFIESLRRESHDFRTMWSSHQVLEREGGKRGFYDSEKGALSFEQATFTLAPNQDAKLVLLLPYSEKENEA
jgi:transcriptional regulator with XRE-family HTH domain